MIGRTAKIFLLALLLQLSTASAFAVTGVDACLRPDGGGDAAVVQSGEEEQASEGGTVVYSTPESGGGDAFDTVMADSE